MKSTLLSVLILSFPPPSSSFLHRNFALHRPNIIEIGSTTALFGKVKKGSLRENFSDDDTSLSTPAKSRKTSSKKKNKTSSSSSGVSPALAQWAESGGTATVTPPTNIVKKTGSDRRKRQASRKAEEATRKATLMKVVEQFEGLLEAEKRDVDGILRVVKEMLTLEGDNSLRVLAAGNFPKDFRMAWVGSDEAVSHLGTGLHKVPLARLQEVFMTIGKGNIEILEIIRILGPFPNVKNTLKGSTQVLKSDSLKITYDSMIDGTGKEILAGTEENEKVVNLDVLLATEEVVVCHVPAGEGEEKKEDVWAENGKDILVFVKEEDLETQLEMLRVS